MALLKNCDNIKFDLLKDYAQLRLKFSLYPFDALLYFPEDILFLFGRRLYCFKTILLQLEACMY